MKKEISVKIIKSAICIIFGVFFLSSVFIIGASCTLSNLGLIKYSLSNPLLYLPILFVVALIIGAFSIYFIKPSNFMEFLILSFAIVTIIILIYTIVTFYANIENITSLESYSYEPYGFAVMKRVQFILYFCLVYFYAPTILPGFFVGGFITYFLKVVRPKKRV